MHRLYIEHCKSKGVLQFVSSDKHNRIFYREVQLFFLSPPKDRCDECVAFENIADQDETQKMIQAKHLVSKEKARGVKTEAKERSKANVQFGAVCFDMQQLLPCPKSNSSTFYYKTLYMDKLCLTFLPKGHTENENDSVHSVIERATKHAVIYSPEQWYSAVRTARKSKTPYHVEELTHAQFIDYKTMSKSVKNLNMDDEGNKVKWSSVTVRQFIVYLASQKIAI